MASFDYVIKDVHGIHARPATELFKLIKGRDCVVKVAKGDKEVPFKGVMGIMSLGAKQGDSVKFSFSKSIYGSQSVNGSAGRFVSERYR